MDLDEVDNVLLFKLYWMSTAESNVFKCKECGITRKENSGHGNTVNHVKDKHQRRLTYNYAIADNAASQGNLEANVIRKVTPEAINAYQ